MSSQAARAAQDVFNTPASKAVPEKQYGFSTYISALGQWWHGILVFVVLIVANAVLQAVFMYPYAAEPIGPEFWLKAALSGITLFVVWGIMISAALSVHHKGIVGFEETFRWFRCHWVNFFIWLFIWIVGGMIFSLFQFWPGLVAVFVTFYIPFAAMDGKRNAFVANFKAIASRPWRYFFTALLTGVLIFGGLYLIGGLTLFSSPNTHGVIMSWLFIGLIGSWMTVAWALLYRSTIVGALAITDEKRAAVSAADDSDSETVTND